MNKQKTIEKRKLVHKKMEDILALATQEERDPTAEERTKYSELEEQYDHLTKDIDMLKRAEERAKEAAKVEAAQSKKENRQTPEEKAEKAFSLLRALQCKIEGKPLEGAELEMHQEGQREAKRAGVSAHGLLVPSFIVDRRAAKSKAEKRALSVGTATAGGNLVADELGEVVLPLYPDLQTQALGARVLPDLNGNLVINRATAGAIGWGTEIHTATDSDPSWTPFTMTPKRMAARTIMSRQLLYQSSPAVERLVMDDLNEVRAIGLDTAVINGSGSSGQPTGILNTSGIGSVAIGTNGGAPLRSHFIDLQTALANANAAKGSLATLTTPGVKGKLQNTLLDSGSGLFVWGDTPNVLAGYRAATSTNVPSNLTKGSGTSLHAAIYGNWADVLIGVWGRFLDIVVDDLTMAETGQIKFIVNGYVDVALRRPSSMAAIVDIDIS